ncbi:NIFU2 [Symbiodinium natans]|uniref:NIFU2 protein n=1 Tax=Symbiodinium natans TaxID=878477 RepID=A0A812TUM0_9DINO|nr:NIFU2 [Symbiodinium natans]
MPQILSESLSALEPRPFNEAEAKEKEAEKPSEPEKKEKPKLTLTWDNVQEVLDELRPYLKSDGGDCKISEIEGSVVKLELIGACSSCSASSVTMKMGIEKTLKERIPEVSEVVAIEQEQEPLTESGIEEVLNGIRPFLSVSGGSIEIFELVDGEDAKVVLKMIGPPLKSMAVRVEVQNRIKRKYPAVQNVNIVGEDGKPPQSA